MKLGGDRVVRYLKQVVDEDPTPGRFLLTGSTNFLTVPTISESLAGRVRILWLWPLSQSEYQQSNPQSLKRWFSTNPDTLRSLIVRPVGVSGQDVPTRRDYLEAVCRGGYPEVVNLDPLMRSDWFESYAETVIERDIVALADLRRQSVIPRLLEWLAARTAQELNAQTACSRLGIDRRTLMSYLRWMETVFFIHRLPPWSRNFAVRPVRRPKIHVTDTGLATGLLGIDADGLQVPTSVATGALVETCAINEIAKQVAVSSIRGRLYHYRDSRKHEIDLIIERSDGRIVAVEVKPTSAPQLEDLRHIKWLRDKLDEVARGAFVRGLLLHAGTHRGSAGDRLQVLPLSAIWE